MKFFAKKLFKGYFIYEGNGPRGLHRGYQIVTLEKKSWATFEEVKKLIESKYGLTGVVIVNVIELDE